MDNATCLEPSPPLVKKAQPSPPKTRNLSKENQTEKQVKEKERPTFAHKVEYYALPPGTPPQILVTFVSPGSTLQDFKIQCAQQIKKLPDELQVSQMEYGRIEAIFKDSMKWCPSLVKQEGKIVVYEIPTNDQDAATRGQPNSMVAQRLAQICLECKVPLTNFQSFQLAHAEKIKKDSFQKIGRPTYAYLPGGLLNHVPDIFIHELCLGVIANTFPQDWGHSTLTIRDAIWNICLMDFPMIKPVLLKVELDDNIFHNWEDLKAQVIVCLWYRSAAWDKLATHENSFGELYLKP